MHTGRDLLHYCESFEEAEKGHAHLDLHAFIVYTAVTYTISQGMYAHQFATALVGQALAQGSVTVAKIVVGRLKQSAKTKPFAAACWLEHECFYASGGRARRSGGTHPINPVQIPSIHLISFSSVPPYRAPWRLRPLGSFLVTWCRASWPLLFRLLQFLQPPAAPRLRHRFLRLLPRERCRASGSRPATTVSRIFT